MEMGTGIAVVETRSTAAGNNGDENIGGHNHDIII
jgi:hypothetical protein